MPFATRQNIHLHWRADGPDAAPPLLLLNSVGADMSMWDGIIPLLDNTVRVLRMDTRGHGGSDVVERDFEIADLAADALSVLDAAGVARATVCGLSLGGMVALHLAATAPGRVERVIACNTSAEVPAKPWLDRAAVVRQEGMAAIVDAVIPRFFSEGFRASDPASLQSIRSRFLATSPEGYAACCEAISRLDLIAKLPAIRCPALVVNGAGDIATPPSEHGDKIASAVRGARTVCLDTGHLSAVEQPEAFARAVLTFMQE